MKQVKKNPASRIQHLASHFSRRVISLLVAEVFLCSTILPAWAAPSPSSSHLRPSDAKAGEIGKDISRELKPEAARLRSASARQARDGGSQDPFLPNEEIEIANVTADFKVRLLRTWERWEKGLQGEPISFIEQPTKQLGHYLLHLDTRFAPQGGPAARVRGAFKPINPDDFNFTKLPFFGDLPILTFKGRRYRIMPPKVSIRRGHYLMISEEVKPQQMSDPIDLEAGLTLARKAGLTIGMNGWGIALVNHLHLSLIPETLPIERLSLVQESTLGDVSLGTLQNDLMVPIVFQASHEAESALAVQRFVAFLLKQDIQHAILLSPHGRVTVYPVTPDISKTAVDILGLSLPGSEAFAGIPIVVNKTLFEKVSPEDFKHGMEEIRADRKGILKNFFREETSKGYAWARDGGEGGMAVREILSVLNLSEARVIRKKGGSEGSMIVTIQIPDWVDREGPPSGLEILKSELFEGRRFELLYNRQGHLIAIFPFMTKALRESIKGAEEDQGGFSTRAHYFDLSPYYFEVPKIGDPEAKTKWDAFTQKAKMDQDAISAYKKLKGVNKTFKNSNIPIVRPVDPSGSYPYVYVELDRRSGEVTIARFHGPRLGDPEQFDEQRFNQLKPDKHQIIFPIFPTVYDPREYLDHDLEFYEAIFAKGNISKEHSVLVVGPGSGIDVWIASLRTGQKIYSIGIDPFEIANLKVLAKIAGFEVEAKLHDNIISEDGTPAFERDFDRIIWNMPSYTYESRFHQAIFGYPPQGEAREHRFSRGRKLEDWHDGDYKGAILRRFARGLPLLLRPGGLALVWNVAHPKLDFVREILRTAGLYKEKAPGEVGLEERLKVRVEDVKNFDERTHFVTARPFLYFVELPETGGPQARAASNPEKEQGPSAVYPPKPIEDGRRRARDGGVQRIILPSAHPHEIKPSLELAPLYP